MPPVIFPVATIPEDIWDCAKINGYDGMRVYAAAAAREQLKAYAGKTHICNKLLTKQPPAPKGAGGCCWI